MNMREYSRRDFVRMSLASAFGAAACPWLPRLAAAAGKKPAKACIVLWMSGGRRQPRQPRTSCGSERAGEAHANKITSAVFTHVHAALPIQGQRRNSGLLSNAQKMFAYACRRALSSDEARTILSSRSRSSARGSRL